MKKYFVFGVLLLNLKLSAFAADSVLFSIEGFQKAIANPPVLNAEPVPLRQAEMGFIIEKMWTEKTNTGEMVQKSLRICEKKAKANVYDARNQDVNYPIVSVGTCETTLDARDGSGRYPMVIDMGGYIFLKPGSGDRLMKNFAPWAFPHSSGGPRWPMNGYLVTPNVDLQEVAFPLGTQPEYFFGNQTISVTVSFLDKN